MMIMMCMCYIYKYSNFTVNRDHCYKSKETKVVTYTCRYCRGLVIAVEIVVLVHII